MKKIGIKLIVLSLVLNTIFIVETTAQEINIGGGLIIGTDHPPLGLQLKGTYGMDMILENLLGSVEFAVFFPTTQNNYNHNRWAVDVDGNYLFWSAVGFDFYGVAGLNITHYSKEANVAWVSDTKGTKPGLNVGAGAIYNFGEKTKAFSEFKYVLSNYDQAAITFGVLFEL